MPTRATPVMQRIYSKRLMYCSHPEACFKTAASLSLNLRVSSAIHYPGPKPACLCRLLCARAVNWSPSAGSAHHKDALLSRRGTDFEALASRETPQCSAELRDAGKADNSYAVRPLMTPAQGH